MREYYASNYGGHHIISVLGLVSSKRAYAIIHFLLGEGMKKCC